MANFQPLKNRFLAEITRFIRLFGLEGPFLDFGAGRGDVSEHLISTHGWNGCLVELDDTARATLRSKPALQSCAIVASAQEAHPPIYSTAFALDVLEHLEDPGAALTQIRDALTAGGHIIATIPYRPLAWGWDDVFYGHVRRMTRAEVISLFESNGFQILETVDPTFPVYSLLRWLMLTLGSRKSAPGGCDSQTSTLQSQRSFAFDERALDSRLHGLVPWKALDGLMRFACEHIYLGSELLVVARKGKAETCQVCLQGRYHFYERDRGWALHMCRRCGSMRTLTSPGNLPAELYQQEYRTGRRGRRFSFGIERLIAHWHRERARRLAATCAGAASILDVGCGRGDLLVELRGRGWEVRGTELNQDARESLAAQGIPAESRPIELIPGESLVDVVSFFHVLEHLPDLDAALEAAHRLTKPGGYCVIEIPNGRGLLHTLAGAAWFGRDLPYHLHHIDPRALAQRLQARGWKLIHASQWSSEFGPFMVGQTLANALFPWARNAFYGSLQGLRLPLASRICAPLQAPLVALGALLYPLLFLATSPWHRSEIAHLVFRREG